MKLFHLESPFMRMLFFLGDLILLNALFLLCCLPVLTVGASAAALYTVALRMAAKDDRGTVKPFLAAFRENFGKATVIWVLFLLAGAILGYGVWLIVQNTASFPTFLKAIYGVIVFFYLAGLAWVFPLQAKFENTVKNTVKNAFILGVGHLIRSVALVVLMLLPALLLLFLTDFFLATCVVWITFGFSAVAVVQGLLINRSLQKYIAPEQSEEAGEAE